MASAEQRIVARVGLISDTHGVLDPRVEKVFTAEKVSAIVHAGDIGAERILFALEAIAPVTAVLGNCDRELYGWPLDRLARTTVCGVRILAVHDRNDIGELPDDVDVVVVGHSHRPRSEWHGRTLLVNPGSASQRRSMPSRSAGILDIAEDGGFSARIVELDDLGPQEPAR